MAKEIEQIRMTPKSTLDAHTGSTPRRKPTPKKSIQEDEGKVTNRSSGDGKRAKCES